MRILVYKQTHIGDPCERGFFGHADCMGRVRSIPFDAAIGVGGTGPAPRHEGISGRVTWVGLAPTFAGRAPSGHPIWKLDPFERLENRGPLLRSVAPRLAKRLYDGRARFIVNLSPAEHAEAQRLIETLLSSGSRGRKRRAGRAGTRPCVPQTREACVADKSCRTRRPPQLRRCR